MRREPLRWYTSRRRNANKKSTARIIFKMAAYQSYKCLHKNPKKIFKMFCFLSQSTLSSADQPLKLRPPAASGLPTIVKTPVISPKSEKPSFTHELRLKYFT